MHPSGTGSVAVASKTKLTRGEQRRKRIFRSLHDCIIKKGYSKTTLAEIAESAEMSPSHLLYYFKGKDAILEDYFQNVALQILERMESFSKHSPQVQIDELAKLFFAGAGITKSEIGFMLECFGVAVNDKVLRKEKAELDVHCKAYLTELFDHAPRPFISNSRDCAEVSYAMLIGLRSAVYFDDNLELSDARRLFKTTMSSLAGISGISAGRRASAI
jgi:AcrR family transcriptional regulator